MKYQTLINKLHALESPAIPYKKRLKVCSSITGHLTFNPETMTAHSYRWYELAKPINGKMVLNTYNYSSTTSKHIWKMRTLFQQLGIKYISIDAPKGLQSLDTALTYACDQYGKLFVQDLYSRTPSKNFRKSRAFKAIELVQKLRGKTETKAVELLITSAVHKYEKIRTQRLATARLDRDMKRLEEDNKLKAQLDSLPHGQAAIEKLLHDTGVRK